MTPTDTRLWHPFASMGAVRGAEFVVTRGEDVWVWDDTGARYLDATASLWYANVGHGRSEIAQAVAAQMAEIEAYSNFGDYVTPAARDLAEQLASRSPMPDSRVFLASGGGDAVDTAVKLVRRYWNLLGRPERTHVIGRTHGYHGTHGFGTSVGGIEDNQSGMGPLAEDFSRVAWDSVDALAGRIAEVGADRVAAVIVEPVIGAGGVHLPPPGYLEGVAAVCREHGVLLVVDAVICGFGRLGTWFGIERWGVVPDLICFAKGVTSGYLPLGGLVVGGHVAEPFWEPGAPAFRHGATYAGHAACCAAALANIDILERDGLLERGRDLEGALLAALQPLQSLGLVAEIRAGVGLMAAVELVAPDAPGTVSELVAVAAARVRGRGVLVRPLASSLAVSPPLTATEDHFAMIADAIGSVLVELERTFATTPSPA